MGCKVSKEEAEAGSVGAVSDTFPAPAPDRTRRSSEDAHEDGALVSPRLPIEEVEGKNVAQDTPKAASPQQQESECETDEAAAPPDKEGDIPVRADTAIVGSPNPNLKKFQDLNTVDPSPAPFVSRFQQPINLYVQLMGLRDLFPCIPCANRQHPAQAASDVQRSNSMLLLGGPSGPGNGGGGDGGGGGEGLLSTELVPYTNDVDKHSGSVSPLSSPPPDVMAYFDQQRESRKSVMGRFFGGFGKKKKQAAGKMDAAPTPASPHGFVPQSQLMNWVEPLLNDADAVVLMRVMLIDVLGNVAHSKVSVGGSRRDGGWFFDKQPKCWMNAHDFCEDANVQQQKQQKQQHVTQPQTPQPLTPQQPTLVEPPPPPPNPNGRRRKRRRRRTTQSAQQRALDIPVRTRNRPLSMFEKIQRGSVYVPDKKARKKRSSKFKTAVIVDGFDIDGEKLPDTFAKPQKSPEQPSKMANNRDVRGSSEPVDVFGNSTAGGSVMQHHSSLILPHSALPSQQPQHHMSALELSSPRPETKTVGEAVDVYEPLQVVEVDSVETFYAGEGTLVETKNVDNAPVKSGRTSLSKRLSSWWKRRKTRKSSSTKVAKAGPVEESVGVSSALVPYVGEDNSELDSVMKKDNLDPQTGMNDGGEPVSEDNDANDTPHIQIDRATTECKCACGSKRTRSHDSVWFSRRRQEDTENGGNSGAPGVVFLVARSLFSCLSHVRVEVRVVRKPKISKKISKTEARKQLQQHIDSVVKALEHNCDLEENAGDSDDSKARAESFGALAAWFHIALKSAALPADGTDKNTDTVALSPSVAGVLPVDKSMLAEHIPLYKRTAAEIRSFFSGLTPFGGTPVANKARKPAAKVQEDTPKASSTYQDTHESKWVENGEDLIDRKKLGDFSVDDATVNSADCDLVEDGSNQHDNDINEYSRGDSAQHSYAATPEFVTPKQVEKAPAGMNSALLTSPMYRQVRRNGGRGNAQQEVSQSPRVPESPASLAGDPPQRQPSPPQHQPPPQPPQTQLRSQNVTRSAEPHMSPADGLEVRAYSMPRDAINAESDGEGNVGNDNNDKNGASGNNDNDKPQPRAKRTYTAATNMIMSFSTIPSPPPPPPEPPRPLSDLPESYRSFRGDLDDGKSEPGVWAAYDRHLTGFGHDEEDENDLDFRGEGSHLFAQREILRKLGGLGSPGAVDDDWDYPDVASSSQQRHQPPPPRFPEKPRHVHFQEPPSSEGIGLFFDAFATHKLRASSVLGGAGYEGWVDGNRSVSNIDGSSVCLRPVAGGSDTGHLWGAGGVQGYFRVFWRPCQPMPQEYAFRSAQMDLAAARHHKQAKKRSLLRRFGAKMLWAVSLGRYKTTRTPSTSQVEAAASHRTTEVPREDSLPYNRGFSTTDVNPFDEEVKVPEDPELAKTHDERIKALTMTPGVGGSRNIRTYAQRANHIRRESDSQVNFRRFRSASVQRYTPPVIFRRIDSGQQDGDGGEGGLSRAPTLSADGLEDLGSPQRTLSFALSTYELMEGAHTDTPAPPNATALQNKMVLYGKKDQFSPSNIVRTQSTVGDAFDFMHSNAVEEDEDEELEASDGPVDDQEDGEGVDAEQYDEEEYEEYSYSEEEQETTEMLLERLRKASSKLDAGLYMGGNYERSRVFIKSRIARGQEHPSMLAPQISHLSVEGKDKTRSAGAAGATATSTGSFSDGNKKQKSKAEEEYAYRLKQAWDHLDECHSTRPPRSIVNVLYYDLVTRAAAFLRGRLSWNGGIELCGRTSSLEITLVSTALISAYGYCSVFYSCPDLNIHNQAARMFVYPYPVHAYCAEGVRNMGSAAPAKQLNVANVRVPAYLRNPMRRRQIIHRRDCVFVELRDSLRGFQGFANRPSGVLTSLRSAVGMRTWEVRGGVGSVKRRQLRISGVIDMSRETFSGASDSYVYECGQGVLGGGSWRDALGWVSGAFNLQAKHMSS